MMLYPPFLEPLQTKGDSGPRELPYQSVFHHAQPLSPVHALWWPCKNSDAAAETVLLFIPGNPGLVEFYTPFLSTIREKDASGRLAILAHAHIGHTPGLGDTSAEYSDHDFGLDLQVRNALDAFDILKTTYGNSTRVVLIGHSVGSWIALQVLKARSDAVDGSFMLFPALSHIASTPNGVKLSWLFKSFMPHLVASVSPVIRLLPHVVLSSIFPSWPSSQLAVLQRFLHSPAAIYASLSMGRDEMKTIRDLDVAALTGNVERLWIYFAEQDDWVGVQKDAILHLVDADPGTVQVVHGHPDIPHSFCINHGEQVAEQCSQWLLSGGFM